MTRSTIVSRARTLTFRRNHLLSVLLYPFNAPESTGLVNYCKNLWKVLLSHPLVILQPNNRIIISMENEWKATRLRFRLQLLRFHSMGREGVVEDERHLQVLSSFIMILLMVGIRPQRYWNGQLLKSSQKTPQSSHGLRSTMTCPPSAGSL